MPIIRLIATALYHSNAVHDSRQYCVVHHNNRWSICYKRLYIAVDALTNGRLESVEWNTGMEWWNGTLEWNYKMVLSII